MRRLSSKEVSTIRTKLAAIEAEKPGGHSWLGSAGWGLGTHMLGSLGAVGGSLGYMGGISRSQPKKFTSNSSATRPSVLTQTISQEAARRGYTTDFSLGGNPNVNPITKTLGIGLRGPHAAAHELGHIRGGGGLLRLNMLGKPITALSSLMTGAISDEDTAFNTALLNDIVAISAGFPLL